MLPRFVRSTLVCLVAIAAFGLVSAQRLHAQVLYGSVAGTVTDQSGAVVPGAAITIVNDNTSLTRNTTTGSAGDYRLTDLPAGTYTLTVNASGFKPVKQTAINVTVGSVNQQNVQLSIGAVTQEVTVSGAAATLQTQEANVHTTISNYAVQNLPLNIYHNFQSVELLSPGVVSLSGFQDFGYPNALADTPDRSFAINTNGLPQHINTSRVDGATDVFLWLPDHMVIIPPASTVEEVNVQTANFNVQKGLTAGAATDVITKSGTNAFHGNIYGYHTDAALDAQNALVHTDSGKKPKNIQNNDGAAIGGPIVKNKVFFFGNWDGYFQRQNAADQNLIPPMDMRNGDYSAYLGAPLFNSAGSPITVCTSTATGPGPNVQLREGMVFDPTTGNPNTGAGRCAFQNNMIPANRMYQGSTNFWQLMAPYTPNTAVVGPFNETTSINDTRLRSSNWNRNIYTGKVDFNISDRQTIWGKYTLQKALLNDGTDYGVAGQGGGTGITDDTAQTVTIGHNWTAKSNLVLTGHIGFTRMGETNTTSDFGKPYGQSVLGLVNSNTPSGDVRYTGMPGIQFNDNWTTLGTNQSWEPVERNDWQLTLDENATWIKNKHTIVFGFDAAHNHMNHWQPEIVCCPRGNVITSDYNTFLNYAGDGSAVTLFDGSGTPLGFNPGPWNTIAAFNLGLSSEVQNGQQFIKATNKDWQEALYIGDTFRVTSKLTVDAGVRWEYFPLITRDGVSKFEVYNTATNQLYLGGLGNHDTHLNNTALGVTSSKALFAPRLGIAYQFNDKTVFRAAYGMTYDTLPLERPLRGFWPYTIGADDFVALSGVSSAVTQYLPFSTFNATTNSVNNIPGSPVTSTGLFEGVPLIGAPTGFESGVITPPGDVTIGTLAPGDFKRGYVQFWNFTVERKLPGNFLLNVGYVGNHLAHEFNGRQVQAAPLGSGSDGQPLFAAFGRTGDTYLFNGYLDSHYNSLQVSVNRQVTNGLFIQGAYTYSKVIGYMDDEGWENGLYFNCTPNSLMPNGCQSLNRHTLSFDRTHVLKMAFIYDLPFGAGQKYATTGAASAVLGGWQLNGIVSGLSGSPLFPSQDSSFLNTPWTSQVPDFTGTLNMTKGRGPGEQWFNTTAFTPIETVQIGNSGRGLSWLRGPGLMQLDLSLFRTFKLTERFKLKARAEMLNFTNTPHWFNPDTGCSITTVGVCGGSLGQITGAFGQRILQLGAEVDF
ncbi:MAG: TonB-dependent receptor [Acidobacteria bacterium]|nr:MAG: TonB-dependent receptor [Acidobacteriota bacterium]